MQRNQLTTETRVRVCTPHFTRRGVGLAMAVSLLFLASQHCKAGPDARYFNRTAAHPASKAEQVVESLQIRPGMHIADLGAGGGYFSYLLANATGPQGRVYAVDVRPDFLNYIQAEAHKRKLTNIQTVQAEANQSNLPDRSVDLLFTRNVFHHIPDQVAYFKKLRKSLRPGARVVVLDNLTSHPTVSAGHTSDPAAIHRTMQAAGYTRIASLSFLEPRQSYQVFTFRP